MWSLLELTRTQCSRSYCRKYTCRLIEDLMHSRCQQFNKLLFS